jgi:fluoride exporter
LPLERVLAVGVGASFGAWLRWSFGVWLNPLFPAVPLGTLSANLLGGLLIGVLMGAADPFRLPILFRLLVVTGFLGGLTTFSTFSAETTNLLLQARYGWMCTAIFLHVAGSLCMTLLGVILVRTYLGE